MPPKRGEARTNVVITRPQVRAGDHLAFGIISIGRRAKGDFKLIGFEGISDVRHRLGCFAKRHRQKTCRLRIKRACMARFIRIQRPFHFVHHKVGTHPRRFIDNQPA